MASNALMQTDLVKLISKKFFSLLCLLLVSSNAFTQTRGRGYDRYESYDDYGGGDGGWFLYFLIAFWGITFFIVIVKMILEFIADNYERWFQSILEFSKVFLVAFIKFGLFISIIIGLVWLYASLDIRWPWYMEYFGRFLACMFWLGFIRYIFFSEKSKQEMIDFFKKPKGLLVGLLIIFLISVVIFG